MENLSYPERALMRHLMKHVYVRDELTAMALHRQGVKHVSALGNPMLDQLLGQPMPEHVAPVIALLPGTRQYSSDALKVMIEALEHLPRATALVAWAGGPLPESVEGWQKERFDSRNGLVCRFVRPNSEIFVYEGRFEDVLATADIVLGTSGTANEQAAASGKPVISFPVPPLYSKAFLVNQKRLLSEALTICEPEVQAIALAIQHFLGDLVAYQKASKMGRRRMGKAGGSAAIVRDILERLEIP